MAPRSEDLTAYGKEPGPNGCPPTGCDGGHLPCAQTVCSACFTRSPGPLGLCAPPAAAHVLIKGDASGSSISSRWKGSLLAVLVMILGEGTPHPHRVLEDSPLPAADWRLRVAALLPATDAIWPSSCLLVWRTRPLRSPNPGGRGIGTPSPSSSPCVSEGAPHFLFLFGVGCPSHISYFFPRWPPSVRHGRSPVLVAWLRTALFTEELGENHRHLIVKNHFSITRGAFLSPGLKDPLPA